MITPEIISALSGLAGVIFGGVAMYVALKKMTPEIVSMQTKTIADMMKTMQAMQSEIDELRKEKRGDVLLTTRISLDAPIHVIDHRLSVIESKAAE